LGRSAAWDVNRVSGTISRAAHSRWKCGALGWRQPRVCRVRARQSPSDRLQWPFQIKRPRMRSAGRLRFKERRHLGRTPNAGRRSVREDLPGSRSLPDQLQIGLSPLWGHGQNFRPRATVGGSERMDFRAGPPWPRLEFPLHRTKRCPTGPRQWWRHSEQFIASALTSGSSSAIRFASSDDHSSHPDRPAPARSAPRFPRRRRSGGIAFAPSGSPSAGTPARS